ncbi:MULTISPECIES: cysteine hydrolase family protein [Mycobacteriaceae]|jgi:nicotinamidase-related amidase|uniref:Isochorismatase n=2 Tax=Mycobacteriaceae TaxID=1762 RepID=A0A0F5MWZ0_9MYCO|nr:MULTISPECIES: isochorismatase family protein [Mycobacteriaceae]KKB99323.1 isochorismatase [Mycolicibacter arupensis]KRQ19692.1 isochorismatase [Mycobacteroides sp. H003]KRQ24531.1 isochorismatase [Mycobacteroides sp. H092]KRQ44881.1 isochorismatase [Mycobacteroides sp. H101]KRQ45390.1 isochorismatase [Mycobacteroides sp. H063]
MTDLTIYAEPDNPALPGSTFVLNREHAALVITDPQIDFLSPEGVSWAVFGDSISENNTVAHIGELFDAAKLMHMTVAVSPHYFYPTDKQWRFGDPLEQFMSTAGMFGRRGAYTTDGFAGSGADFLPAYQHHIHDGQTVIASPHKIVGPESNDLVLQLRKRGVNQVILAGMAANLCVEGHMRELVEQGFEVAVVKDATAGPRLPEGDGYLAALVNFRFLASAVWTTAEAIALLKEADR